MQTSTSDLILRVARWFRSREITDAVVGYSGGVDSATTALLLHAAGVAVHLVVCDAPNQSYSSPMGGHAGGNTFGQVAEAKSLTYVKLPFCFYHGKPDQEKAANEAALPIQRVAAYYAKAAELRVLGKKTVVVGTVNFSEAAFLGFWGKASDAAQDVYLISHLTKTEVYALARDLDVPEVILNAEPSGDLLFSKTNDRKMIGASYDKIDAIIQVAEHCGNMDVNYELRCGDLPMDDVQIFADNIVRNGFKYDLPFPGFHIDDRLEQFRKESYPMMHHIACQIAQRKIASA